MSEGEENVLNGVRFSLTYCAREREQRGSLKIPYWRRSKSLICEVLCEASIHGEIRLLLSFMQEATVEAASFCLVATSAKIKRGTTCLAPFFIFLSESLVAEHK